MKKSSTKSQHVLNGVTVVVQAYGVERTQLEA